MPKQLLERCNPDSIREFRAAAQVRFNDALAMAEKGRTTGAIYLWGYTVEMVLKAAYFACLAIQENQALTWRGDIGPAIDIGRQKYNINWTKKGAGHNVRAWAELLVVEQSSASNALFPLANDVQQRARLIERLWNESLRYRRNRAYEHEMSQVRAAAEWFLAHALEI